MLAELYRKRRELQLANAQLSAAKSTMEAEKAARWKDSMHRCRTQYRLGARNEELQKEIAFRSMPRKPA